MKNKGWINQGIMFGLVLFLVIGWVNNVTANLLYNCTGAETLIQGHYSVIQPLNMTGGIIYNISYVKNGTAIFSMSNTTNIGITDGLPVNSSNSSIIEKLVWNTTIGAGTHVGIYSYYQDLDLYLNSSVNEYYFVVFRGTDAGRIVGNICYPTNEYWLKHGVDGENWSNQTSGPEVYNNGSMSLIIYGDREYIPPVNVTVTGLVKDIVTGLAIPNAFVNLTSVLHSYITYTDATGIFSITAEDQQTYTLTVIESGYQDYIDAQFIDGNYTFGTIYLYPLGYNITTQSAYHRIIFVDSERLAPIVGVSVNLEYVEGCECVIGNVFTETTDSEGIISAWLPKGTYDIELQGYELWDDDGFWKLEIEANMNEDYYHTFFAKYLNDTYSLNITFIEESVYDYALISDVTVHLWSSTYYINKTSDVNGNVFLTLPQSGISAGGYDYIFKKNGYHADTGTLYIDYTTGNITLFWILDRVELIAVCMNVTDCYSPNQSHVISNATVYFNQYVVGNLIRSYSGNTSADGTVCFTLEDEGSYKIKVTALDYFSEEWGLMYIDGDYNFSTCLSNTTDVPEYCIDGNVSYNNILMQGILVTIFKPQSLVSGNTYAVQTDFNGYYQFCNLRSQEVWALRIDESEAFNSEYYEFLVVDQNLTHNFNLSLSEITYIYQGNFYYEDLEAIRWIPVENVQVRLILGIDTNISYETKTNSEGYFKFDEVIRGDYTLYGIKALYKPYSKALTINYDVMIRDFHFLESAYTFTTLRLEFVDVNGTRLSNVRCKISSDLVDEIKSSDENGEIAFRLIHGDYLLEYEKEDYQSNSKNVFVDESHNFYRIELEEDLGSGISELLSGKWDKERFEAYLWDVVPPMFVILLFVAFYTFVMCGIKSPCG